MSSGQDSSLLELVLHNENLIYGNIFDGSINGCLCLRSRNICRHVYHLHPDESQFYY